MQTAVCSLNCVWGQYNRKTSRMTYTEKYFTNEDNNIIRVRSTSIILLIFMSDIFFLYMFDEGCFTFIIHHFVRFMGQIVRIFNERT